jgi:AcrR family transcriptional regulator
MARPLIPAEVIYERALALLDAEGIDALAARRLTSELRISTKTLYQQVGNRDQLIRALVARHFSKLRLEFHERETWEETALAWCIALHDALAAHPHLTQLMTLDDRQAVTVYGSELVAATVREGFSRSLAIDCCRALANVTINHSIAEVKTLTSSSLNAETEAELAKMRKNFPKAIGFIVTGVRAKASSEGSRRTRRRSDKQSATARPVRR